VLFHEVWRDPDAVMSGALRLGYAAAKLCAEVSFRNGRIDCFLFTVSLTHVLLRFAVSAGEVGGGDRGSDECRRKWRGRLVAFLTDVAAPMLRRFLVQAEKALEEGLVVNFAAFIALCEMNRLWAADDDLITLSSGDQTNSYAVLLATSCHVVQWSNKAAQQDSFHLPSDFLFEGLQLCRDRLMKWCLKQSDARRLGSILESARFFALRERPFSSLFMSGGLPTAVWSGVQVRHFTPKQSLSLNIALPK